MTTSRTRTPKRRLSAKPVLDAKALLLKLNERLATERAGLNRCQKRLVRAFHAYERQLRHVGRLERRIAKLANT
jgi:CelD/BcsL family acetyltransferase involved in cellulose biosynthesis